MRKRLVWSAVIAVALAFLIPVHPHRLDFDRAFSAWLQHPSTATEAEFRRQQRLNDVERLKVQGVAAVVLFATISGSLLVIRQITGKNS